MAGKQKIYVQSGFSRIVYAIIAPAFHYWAAARRHYGYNPTVRSCCPWYQLIAVASIPTTVASRSFLHHGGKSAATVATTVTYDGSQRLKEGGEDGTEMYDEVAGAADLTLESSSQDLAAFQALQTGFRLYEKGDINGSIEYYRLAIDLKRDMSLAWLKLGGALTDIHQQDEAIAAYEMVTKIPTAPRLYAATAFCNHGHLVQTRAGVDYALLKEGLSLFRRGLERDPNHANCMYNLGLGLEKFARYKEARILYRRALERDPSMGNAHLNLGNIAFRAGDWEEGVSRYERAYLSPDADQRLRSVSSFMLGQIYRHVMGKTREALGYYRRSYNIDNSYGSALACVLQSLRSLCLWEDWEILESQVASLIIADIDLEREPGSQSPYETRLTGELKPSQHLGLARLASKRYDKVARLPLKKEHLGTFQRRSEEVTQDAKLRGNGSSFRETLQEEENRVRWEEGRRSKGELEAKLVVAYWSFDIRKHAMGYLTRGLFCSHQLHDRIFMVIASYGNNDGSSIRQSGERCAGKFLDVASLGDVEAAEAVAREKPDIFVDLIAHTTGARQGIPALKPAPIVASYLGYPGTVGADYNDYTIADKTVLPPELAGIGFSEKLVYLPHSYQANDYNVSYPFCGGGEGLLECQESFRNSMRINDNQNRWGHRGPILCNYNTIHKMEPESFTVFMNILRRVPGSILQLLDSSRNDAEGVEFNLKAEAAARGVHPDRVNLDTILPRGEHVWRMSGSCDLFVDSFVYGAHTTAADALWAGLPILTLRGYGVDDTPVGQMSGRVGTSLLTTLGLPELSFHGVKELEDAAVSLLKSPRILSILRKRLLSATINSPLFDTHRISTNLERAYEAMWEVRNMGLSTRHIVVDPMQGALPPTPLEFEGDGDTIDDPGMLPTEAWITESMVVGKAKKDDMASRAIKTIIGWEEKQTEEGARAALAATGRLLAGDPLNIDGMHLMGVALHFLKRHEEAAVVMERAALLATAHLYKNSNLDVGMLWRNLESVQLALADASERPLPVETLIKPYLKGLAIDPSEPTPLHLILKVHLRRQEYSTCASTFWAYWPGIRGHSPQQKESLTASERPNAEGEMFNKSFGDGWAWDTWRRGDENMVSDLAGVVASCFAGIDRFEESWRAWKFAAEIQRQNQFFPMQYATALSAAGYVEEAHEVFAHVIRRLNYVWFNMEGGSEVVRWLRPGGLDGQDPPIVVALYCFEYGNAWFPNWGPSSLGKGLGGSEEAVINLSRELARLGFWVEVYADPVGVDVGVDKKGSRGESGGGVIWYPYKAYDISNPPDVFVAWRYHISLPLGMGSGRRFLWLHDVLQQPFPKSLTKSLDGIFCPSLYHINLIQPTPVRALGRVLPNGIEPRIFMDGENKPDRFVYGSAPNRGLRAVLIAWPYIRSEIPTATLEVYYGFNPNFMKWGRVHIAYFHEWMTETKKLLHQEGVLYKGMVDHDTLHDAYARSGFVLYPTAFPETGCMSLVKAMAMGAIPITSRFPNSTLPELTTAWDMGPIEPLSTRVRLAEHDLPWLESWAHAVVEASKTDSAERLKTAKQMVPPLETREANSGHPLCTEIGCNNVSNTLSVRDRKTLPPTRSPYSTVSMVGEVSSEEAHSDLEGGEGRSVQERRRAMKLAIREKFALNATAKLWAREMEGRHLYWEGDEMRRDDGSVDFGWGYR